MSAVIVTRGDVDLTPVLESLIFDDVVVWDNSKGLDLMTHGRVYAQGIAKHDVIYSQDDDIIHSAENQLRILDGYRFGTLTGCMWEAWSAGAYAQGIENGYDDLVFPGSGSVYDGWVTTSAVARYLDRFPADDFFRLWSDTIVGILAPTQQLDIRFEELPWAEGPTRMADIPDGVAQKTEAIRRARSIRDATK